MILPKARRERREVIAQYCKRLSWSQTAVAWCEQASPTQEEFLEQVMAAELANREVGRRARLLSRAGFPAHKTLTDFDRHVVQLPSTLTWEDLEHGTFIADHRNLNRASGACNGGVPERRDQDVDTHEFSHGGGCFRDYRGGRVLDPRIVAAWAGALVDLGRCGNPRVSGGPVQ